MSAHHPSFATCAHTLLPRDAPPACPHACTPDVVAVLYTPWMIQDQWIVSSGAWKDPRLDEALDISLSTVKGCASKAMKWHSGLAGSGGAAPAAAAAVKEAVALADASAKGAVSSDAVSSITSVHKRVEIAVQEIQDSNGNTSPPPSPPAVQLPARSRLLRRQPRRATAAAPPPQQ